MTHVAAAFHFRHYWSHDAAYEETARQTAELFWKACNPLASFSAERGLQPGDAPRRVHDQLTGETRSILIAGHMPSLSRLLASLLGEQDDSASVVFPQHGCVALEPDGDLWKETWRLEADVPPKDEC